LAVNNPIDGAIDDSKETKKGGLPLWSLKQLRGNHRKWECDDNNGRISPPELVFLPLNMRSPLAKEKTHQHKLQTTLGRNGNWD